MSVGLRGLVFSTTGSVLVLMLGTLSRASTFDINIQYIGATPTASQQAAIAEAELFWEDVIVGYRESVSVTGPTININVGALDGSGGSVARSQITTGVAAIDFLYSTEGNLLLDSVDLPAIEASGRLAAVVANQMGVLLGIGSMWSSSNSPFGLPGFQELIIPGSGQYTGSAGVAAYQAEFGQTTPFVPVETSGGQADVFWDEINGGGLPTGITDIIGRDFRDELMTGWIDASTFLSNTSRLSLYDIGYDVSKLLNGDADGDGDVDGDDLIAVQTNFGAVGPLPLLGDADGDEDVDGDDLIAVQTNFGAVVTVAGQAIPEPGPLTLIAVAAMGAVARGSGRRTRGEVR